MKRMVWGGPTPDQCCCGRPLFDLTEWSSGWRRQLGRYRQCRKFARNGLTYMLRPWALNHESKVVCEKVDHRHGQPDEVHCIGIARAYR